MTESSVTEYTLLKSELKEIKDCINRYIGYIIGSNGLIFILSSLFYANYSADKEHSGIVILVFLSTGWLILVFLYSIINYKFNSHNRHVGYMHVLVQEVDHKKFSFKNGYIPVKQIQGLAIPKEKETPKGDEVSLILWEYIMTRWNSKKIPNEYPEFSYDKIDFRYESGKYDFGDFRIPPKYPVTDPLDKPFDNIYQAFNRYIVWASCTPWVWKNWDLILLRPRFYDKFKFSSWGYPRHISLLIGVIYLIISIGIAFTLSRVSPSMYFPTKYIGVSFLKLFCMVSVITFLWGIFNSLRLQVGDKTSDYYCWAFLIFRVQYLNHKGIRPIYFSTAFIRYVKSLRISFKLRELNSEQDFVELTRYKPSRFGKSANELKEYLIDRLERGLLIREKYKPYLKTIKEEILSTENGSGSTKTERAQQA